MEDLWQTAKKNATKSSAFLPEYLSILALLRNKTFEGKNNYIRNQIV